MKICEFCNQQCIETTVGYPSTCQLCQSCMVEYFQFATNLICFIDDVDYRLQFATGSHIAIIGGLDVHPPDDEPVQIYITLDSVPDNINPDNVKSFIQRILKLKAFL
jgi:hypothetical protein